MAYSPKVGSGVLISDSLQETVTKSVGASDRRLWSTTMKDLRLRHRTGMGTARPARFAASGRA